MVLFLFLVMEWFLPLFGSEDGLIPIFCLIGVMVEEDGRSSNCRQLQSRGARLSSFVAPLLLPRVCNVYSSLCHSDASSSPHHSHLMSSSIWQRHICCSPLRNGAMPCTGACPSTPKPCPHASGRPSALEPHTTPLLAPLPFTLPVPQCLIV